MDRYIPEPTYDIAYMFREILVPFDGQEHSIKALKVALDFSLRYGSKVTVLYVKGLKESMKNAEGILEKAVKLAKNKDVEIQVKVREVEGEGDTIANQILKEVNEEMYDAVIIASRGKTCADALIFSSTTVPVALCAPCTVMIVR